MARNVALDVLDDIRIAAPCHMSWDAMDGDGAVRHCQACRRHVYDLSQMTLDEAAQTILEHEGRLCVRLYRRADGTVITRDCPIGLRAIRRRTARAIARIAAAVGLLVTGTIVMARTGRVPPVNTLRTCEPYASVAAKLAPATPPAVPPQWTMGVMMHKHHHHPWHGTHGPCR